MKKLLVELTDEEDKIIIKAGNEGITATVEITGEDTLKAIRQFIEKASPALMMKMQELIGDYIWGKTSTDKS